MTIYKASLNLISLLRKAKTIGGKYLKRWQVSNPKTGKMKWVYKYKPVSQRGAHEVTGKTFEKKTGLGKEAHKAAVEKALQGGNRVSLHILRDYPDLVQKYGMSKRLERADKINAKVREIREKNKQNQVKPEGISPKQENNFETMPENVTEQDREKFKEFIDTAKEIKEKLSAETEPVKADTEKPSENQIPTVKISNFKDMEGTRDKNANGKTFDSISERKIAEYAKTNMPNEPWYRAKNYIITALRGNPKKYSLGIKSLARDIYEEFQPGSWEKINPSKKSIGQESQDIESLGKKYNGTKIGNVSITVNGQNAILSFPYDPEFSNKLKNNYGASWDSEDKKWIINISDLPKLDKLINKTEKIKETAKKAADDARREREYKENIEKQQHYERQKQEYEKAKEESRKKQVEIDRQNAAKKRIYLNVSYAQKDHAKMYGAKWEPDLKKWYIYDDNQNKDKLKQYMPVEKPAQPSGVLGKDYITREIDYHGFYHEKPGDIVFHDGEYKKIKSVNAVHKKENDFNTPYSHTKLTIEFEPIKSEEDKKRVKKMEEEHLIIG